MDYGRRVQTLRELRDLTQRELGRATGLGNSTISRIENGDRKLSLEEAVVIAEALEVTLTELAGTLDEREKQLAHKVHDCLKEGKRLLALLNELESVAVPA